MEGKVRSVSNQSTTSTVVLSQLSLKPMCRSLRSYSWKGLELTSLQVRGKAIPEDRCNDRDGSQQQKYSGARSLLLCQHGWDRSFPVRWDTGDSATVLIAKPACISMTFRFLNSGSPWEWIYIHLRLCEEQGKTYMTYQYTFHMHT